MSEKNHQTIVHNIFLKYNIVASLVVLCAEKVSKKRKKRLKPKKRIVFVEYIQHNVKYRNTKLLTLHSIAGVNEA